jgi:hypothetical protein
VPSQRSLWFVRVNPAVPADRKKERNTARHVRVDFCIQRLEVHLEQRPEQHGHGDDIQEEAGLDGLPEGAKITYDIISDRGKESAGNLRLK